MITHQAKHRERAGFTLVETAMGSVVVAILLGAGLTAVTQATKARKIAQERALAQAYAQEIIEEIASKEYWDADEYMPPLGIDPGEVAGNRATYDDCDDYAGLTMSPITLESGDALSDLTWQAKINVHWVRADDFTIEWPKESGLKCIVVEIYKKGRRVLGTSALRSSAWEDVK